MRGFRIFSLAGIAVAVSPWYLLLLLYWASIGDPKSGLVWGVVVTLSLLVHEFGHALVARRYRLSPRILLWGLGGLTIHERARRDRDSALIIAAGPVAGLVLGALTYLFVLSDIQLANGADGMRWQEQIVRMLLWVNIAWSGVNLLPIWPLDGGQLFRLAMLRSMDQVRAQKVTHWVSLIVIGLGVVASWSVIGGPLLLILAFFIALENFRVLSSGIPAAAGKPTENKVAIGLLVAARVAYVSQEWREAVRLCQQIRSESNLPAGVIEEVWRILGVCHARLENFHDALIYLNRAAPSADVIEARLECLFQLEQDDELEALVTSPEFETLEPDRRTEILEQLAAAGIHPV